MSMLSSQELQTARSTLEVLQNPVVLKVNLTKDTLSEKFRKFIEELASVSSKLRPIYTTYDENDPPTIEIKPNFRYMALPSGREMAPFLQCLISRSSGETSLAERTLSTMAKFITSTKVEVMVSPTCPHCPTVVGLVNQLAITSAYLEVTIVDITFFPEFADKYNIRAVPTLVIGEQEQLVGNISEDLLVDKLTCQSPATFHPESFKKIVKEGDAEKLAGMMVADGDVYGGALELLADPDWSVRMGMMVVLEEVATLRPDLLQHVYPYVVDLLDHGDANQRGDMAYLLGLIGNVSVLGPLKMLLNDNNPEVAEAAFEAVKQIQEREALARWRKSVNHRERREHRGRF
jgi:alkyl hydroperoxide reductase subunit AhpF